MRVLKWIGYTLAAIVVLSVVLGVGLFITTVGVFIAGVLLVVVGVGFIAFLIKDTVEPSKPTPTGSGDP